MITDINGRSSVGPGLRLEKLQPYWNEYFIYQNDTSNLHAISERELILELDEARSHIKPYLDAQQIIGRILTRLGTTGQFHRQFGERFPDLRPNQILGMQLYAIMVADPEHWVYHPTQHVGHVFPHATYFRPNLR
ncbi:hypothetical protein M1M11_25345 [Pseudomonas azerbaijanoccidens]|uniref:hypothetical protein n=1 Tax=Pseudomonas azerbaijanoccidentalis TaxID=2842347 RepID=UPI00200B4B62|nr:hypothetical protein [Pseudomonas azerbaijanoccidentalis]MCK8668211.1 hypothetical protein [Pseudomonas azerbaijanoccidentalis]